MDLVTKLQKYTLSPIDKGHKKYIRTSSERLMYVKFTSCVYGVHTVDQLVRSSKNETLYVYPTRDQTQTGCSDIMFVIITIVKASVCFPGLLPKIPRSWSQFYEIQTGRWPREVLHAAKTKTIRRWELNTSNKK